MAEPKPIYLEEKYKLPLYVKKYETINIIFKPELQPTDTTTIDVIKRKHTQLSQLWQTAIDCFDSAIKTCFKEHLDRGKFKTDDFSQDVAEDIQNIMRHIMINEACLNIEGAREGSRKYTKFELKYLEG